MAREDTELKRRVRGRGELPVRAFVLPTPGALIIFAILVAIVLILVYVSR